MASAGTANGSQEAARGGGRAASSCENLKNYEHRIHFYDRFEMLRARSLDGVINFQRYTIVRKSLNVIITSLERVHVYTHYEYYLIIA